MITNVRAWLFNKLRDQMDRSGPRFGEIHERPEDWQGWIPTSMALPPQGHDVLIALPDGTGYSNVAVAAWWGDMWMYPNTTPGFPRDVVAYWAEIPEPPV